MMMEDSTFTQTLLETFSAEPVYNENSMVQLRQRSKKAFENSVICYLDALTWYRLYQVKKKKPRFPGQPADWNEFCEQVLGRSSGDVQERIQQALVYSFLSIEEVGIYAL